MNSALLILSCVAAFACAQRTHKSPLDPPLCQCGAFVTVQGEKQEVLKLPVIDVNDCSQETQCADTCIIEWELMTHEGDLCSPTPDRGQIGQIMCDNLLFLGHQDIGPLLVSLNYMICDNLWDSSGQVSKQQLICEKGLFTTEC